MKILKSYSSIAKNLFIEQDDMDKKIKYKTKDGKEKEVTVGGALKQGEKHPAFKQAKSMTDKGEKPDTSKKIQPAEFERDSDKPIVKKKTKVKKKAKVSSKQKKKIKSTLKKAVSKASSGKKTDFSNILDDILGVLKLGK